jgi:hypothetical protein
MFSCEGALPSFEGRLVSHCIWNADDQGSEYRDIAVGAMILALPWFSPLNEVVSRRDHRLHRDKDALQLCDAGCGCPLFGLSRPLE